MVWRITPTQFMPGEGSLSFCIDAGYAPSYPGTGSVWLDIAGGNNATLTNGPTYSSANNGSILFDGANDYAVTPATTLDLSGSHTISAFVSPSFASTSTAGAAIFDFSSSNGVTRSYLRWENPSLGFYWDNPGNNAHVFARTSTVPTFSSGSWLHICLVQTAGTGGQFYINGSSVATSRGPGSPSAVSLSAFPINIGYGRINNYYWNGKIAVVHLFNEALTASAVLRVFNLYRSRYGL